MGSRGPGKTPQEILKLSGSWRGDRGGEPKAESATPKSLRCPGWLSEVVVRHSVELLGEWKVYSKLMQSSCPPTEIHRIITLLLTLAGHRSR